MDLFRNLIACLAILMASAGPLPLVAHRMTCHHSHAEWEQGEADSCHHLCGCAVTKTGSGSTLQLASADEDECAACFQLAQLSQPTAQNSLRILLQLSPELIIGGAIISTATVLGPNAPRGPPVA